MKREVWEIDQDGFQKEVYLLEVEFDENNNPILPIDYVLPYGPDETFHTPKYERTLKKFVETKTPEEINSIIKTSFPVTELDALKAENMELNLQMIELWETLINGGLI